MVPKRISEKRFQKQVPKRGFENRLRKEVSKLAARLAGWLMQWHQFLMRCLEQQNRLQKKLSERLAPLDITGDQLGAYDRVL